jgi:enoyl-CoA hydratase/carnithine racemase
MCNCTSENLEIPGLVLTHHPGMTETNGIGGNMTMAEITIDTGTNELLCAIRERVAVITLNRPEARNALSDHLTPALRAMIRACGENTGVGALLITGAGTAFCAGGDVKGMGARRDRKKLDMSHDEKVADLQERQRLLTGALISVRKPTIAALPGPAVGAGLAIAMACDIRIAAESAFVSTGYLRVGLSGDYGIAWLLTRLVGTSRARELMLPPTRSAPRDARRSASSTAWSLMPGSRMKPLRWPDRWPKGRRSRCAT